MSTPTDFDIGPLTWVKGEIDQALERSLGCLREYAANPTDANQIRFAQTHFHQAHGALQIVGLDGVTRLSEELDGLLADVAKAGVAPRPETVAVAERAFGAVTGYLDKLLGGEANRPLRLFAVYREVAKARGRDTIDAVDLYYPDLSRRPPRREKPPVELSAGGAAQYYRQQRGRYQRGLLKWLRKDWSGVEDMRAAVAAVEAAQVNAASRAFWWVALGFFDALFAKALSDQPFTVRLANRVEHQLKRLVEGSGTVAERLMREALFAVARARPATEHVRNVQEVFRLAGTVPTSFERDGEGAPLHPALRALREVIGAAKTAWNKVASGHQPSLASFRDAVAQMRVRSAALKQPQLAALTQDLAAVAGWIGGALDKVNDSVAMEVATTLLLAESAADSFANLGTEFAQQVVLMHGRIAACIKGETPRAGVPVLDEISRRAQERLLMAQVVSEIQASLRAIEQALDAFFRDTAKQGDLVTLDKPIRQVLGALTMLNEDRAAAALSGCAAEIHRFARGDYVPAPADFERVASTLSGLGFYVDALQHGKPVFEQFMQPISAKKAEALEQSGVLEPPATVEAELERDKKDFHKAFEQWKQHPEDAQLKESLKTKASALQKDAGLIADARLEGQASEMVQLLAASDAKPFDPKVSQVLVAITPSATAPQPSPEAQKFIAASEQSVDAELLAVYLEEAVDVLATIGEHLSQVRATPENIELLRTIRRGYHTLKGSGRMVGLTRLGDAAWAVEQVMNQWLEEERAATPDLFTLIDVAREFFAGAVAELKAGKPSPDESRIVALANQVKRGEPLADTVAAAAAAGPAGAIEFPEIDVTAIAPPHLPEVLTAARATPATIAPRSPAPAVSVTGPTPPAPEEMVIVGDLQLSPALFGAFLEESRNHLAFMDAARARLIGGRRVTDELERAAHTLAGIAGTVKFEAMQAVGHALEGTFERWQDKEAGPEALALFGDAIDTLKSMLDAAAARKLPAAVPGLIARLNRAGGATAPAAEASAAAEPALGEMQIGWAAPDSPAPGAAASGAPGIELDFSDIALPAAAASAPAAAAARAHDGSHAPREWAVETSAPRTPEPRTPSSNVVAFPLQAEEPAAVAVEELPPERRNRRLDDDIDPDLLPIFLEEAQELVPAVGQGIRDWRANSTTVALGNALQRTLHTLKGSARMCGAMALGELTHAMESRVENALSLKTLPAALFDDLENSYDRMGLLYEQLVNPEAAAPLPEELDSEPVLAPAAPVAPEPQVVAAVDALAPAAPHKQSAQAPQAEPDQAAQNRAVLRVRADLIDRLVNEAGEVSIARSRIEGDLRAIKGALFELTENVNRLRAQLREIEIQAEGQMQSRVAHAQELEQSFDPLEFDRFTRFQELTRMMAESVNDVSTVQQNLLKALGESEIALSAQARLTRGLHSNLMRIRMVPFASISERLFRLVRQAAKETEKRVVLDVRGGQVELDRSVLERITAPFEHMLRNAVAHGIESAAARARKGKPELGEIKIDVRQEGNEIVLAVADDGAGLSLERIRARAIALGLLPAEDLPTDGEITEFIFHPGFSTVEEVTQLAGRGVGMDVVKSEIAALGGRVEVASEPDKGTRFTIFLPLTLAVTQAVLVHAGGTTYAIPAAMVEQVRQVKAAELAALQAMAEAQWQNRHYPFRYLPRLLGDAEFTPEPRRITPLMFLRTGANMVAIQVEEVIGNQEIVVKNTGPLLARIAGITGATVLGNGEIVLIINPVILASREQAAARAFGGATVRSAPEVAPVVTPTVMIVDDSLTVRKITGRLLAREGYAVLTAKDGVDAMEQLQDALPDVMLVDIEMPRMDGFDLTRNVRADARLKQIPIIMITSRTAEKHRNYAKQIGVNVYLGKPYQEEELLSHIAGFVAKPELA